MLENIKENLRQEKLLIEKARVLRKAMLQNPEKKQIYKKSIIAILNQINLLNRALPELLKETSPLKTIQRKNPVQITHKTPEKKRVITINREDKKRYLEELRLSEEGLAAIRKSHQEEKIVQTKPNEFARLSNKVFRRYSEKLAPKMKNLAEDLKRGNVPFLLSTYISMAIMSTLISFITGALIFVTLVIADPSKVILFWIPIVLPLITLFLFYIYPASEASSSKKRISQELPFVAIHMAAIAGSDIEPSKIFRIIAESKEYPSIGAELKKVLSQVEIYGYDLVTSLKNVARLTSNEKLAELFNGLATNISTGGELKDYLEKKAETFLMDYKLERKRYTDLAGTFMDIYISILIAAPLILMMVFIVMNISGLTIAGLGINTLLAISIAAIVLVNVIFLVILSIKQPKI
ncbi:hypothetical protein D6829_02735 [Candidatus Pacearchaeota archaeon]|nr:MAG: hypothetical protein D6829_02735 [Candidatus Pacearchaeota archaeon]